MRLNSVQKKRPPFLAEVFDLNADTFLTQIAPPRWHNNDDANNNEDGTDNECNVH